MKIENIIRNLKKDGFKITYKKWGYWNGVPHVEFDGFSFTIAEYTSQNNWLSCNLDFIFNHVKNALNITQRNNPILLKKIQQVPFEDWYYSRFLILSMEHYYMYKKNKYPFDDDYCKVLEQLKNEIE